MRQGHRSVSDYAIDFQTLATSSGWNADALFDTFLNGLSEDIKDDDLPMTYPTPARPWLTLPSGSISGYNSADA